MRSVLGGGGKGGQGQGQGNRVEILSEAVNWDISSFVE